MFIDTIKIVTFGNLQLLLNYRPASVGQLVVNGLKKLRNPQQRSTAVTGLILMLQNAMLRKGWLRNNCSF